MQHTKTATPKSKVILMWLLFLTIPIVITVLWSSGNQERPSSTGETFNAGFTIVMLIIAALCFIAGVAAYLVLVTTNCFTFNFQQPIWGEMKTKQYFSNVVVQSALGVAVGLALLPFVRPLLARYGVTGQISFIIPIIATIMILQVAAIFILIWAPVERRLITKRLRARGITDTQLQMAHLIGISNPAQSSLKKFSAVEDDIGALWIGPEQLVYYGDKDQFGISRGQLTELERKADTGGTTMLGGLQHLILHVAQPDGTIRQIRLHAEGHWTIGSKKRAMNQMEEQIVNWHAAGTQIPVAQPVL